MELAAEINEKISGIVWGAPMLALMLFTGGYFTLRSKFFQIRRFGHCLKKTVFASRADKSAKTAENPETISQFRAMCSALAATLGTGNIAGVSTALAMGGAGAVFWMWISALLGMMTGYAENVLGIFYRKKDKKGVWRGGAMRYIREGLAEKRLTKPLAKPLSVISAGLCVLAAFGMGDMAQMNAAAEALEVNFGIAPIVTGAVLAVCAAAVMAGGVKRIGSITAKIVPLMSGFYMIGSLYILIANAPRIPSMLCGIFESALGLGAIGGGAAGFAVKKAVSYGIRRGVFSNEAGLGTSVLAHAAGDVKEPSVQGMWSVFEVFFDTIVMCSLTAFVLLASPCKAPSAAEALNNVTLETQYFALTEESGLISSGAPLPTVLKSSSPSPTSAVLSKDRPSHQISAVTSPATDLVLPLPLTALAPDKPAAPASPEAFAAEPATTTPPVKFTPTEPAETPSTEAASIIKSTMPLNHTALTPAERVAPTSPEAFAAEPATTTPPVKITLTAPAAIPSTETSPNVLTNPTTRSFAATISLDLARSDEESVDGADLAKLNLMRKNGAVFTTSADGSVGLAAASVMALGGNVELTSEGVSGAAGGRELRCRTVYGGDFTVCLGEGGVTFSNIMTVRGIQSRDASGAPLWLDEEKTRPMIETVEIAPLNGVGLATYAFSGSFGGAAGKLLAAAVLLFAFSTVLGWSHFGAEAAVFLFGEKAVVPFRAAFVVLGTVGACVELGIVWDISDTVNGLMAIPNLFAVLCLSKKVLDITRNYEDRTFRKKAVKPLLSAWDKE